MLCRSLYFLEKRQLMKCRASQCILIGCCTDVDSSKSEKRYIIIHSLAVWVRTIKRKEMWKEGDYHLGGAEDFSFMS